ncbi:glycosyltransferase [Cellulomonas sp. HZM]|uniref:glycosyltransferase n=1 Tax=Cellulomonas sp. HZM TaxID=1454010 RepID=UPI00068B9D4A|nr:glycosyltransferase [Cellulomonas sp. HZM]
MDAPRGPDPATVYLVVGRFSADSGGRTQSALTRAALLAPHYRSVQLVTFNHRLAYDEIMTSWRQRYSLPENVVLANLFEHLAGEPLYAVGRRTPFKPAPGMKRRRGREGQWEVRDEDRALRARYVLREDGSLNYSDEWADGTRVRHSNFDRTGALRVVTTTEGKTPVARRYLTPGGEPYLEERIGSDGSSHLRVLRGPVATGDEELPQRELELRWFGTLAGSGRDAVFLCESRSYDGHVVRLNPHMPPVASVASIHSCHLRPPYDDPQNVWTYNDWALTNAAAFSRLVLLSRGQAADVEAHYGRSPGVVVLPHAVGEPPASSPRLRGRVKRMVRRPPHVVVVTRLVPHKRVDDVVRAFRTVVDRAPEARLRIWGSGVAEADLRALVTELGLAGSVTFEGFTADPVKALRSGCVAVSASRSEGFGIATLEALAVGTPVVSYDYPYGPRDLVGRSAGWLVPSGDVAALAAALERAVRHPIRSRIKGIMALRVRRTYSERGHDERWLALVADVLRERRALDAG